MISVAALKKAVRNRKVLIDSNIIIYLTDMIQPFAPIAQQLFKMVEGGDTEAVISILSVSEVMQGPLRNGDKHITREVRDYLTNFPNCHIQDITFSVLEEIGRDENVAWSRLRTIDSLIIASGLINDVDLFISNDRHFKKSLPRQMSFSFH